MVRVVGLLQCLRVAAVCWLGSQLPQAVFKLNRPPFLVEEQNVDLLELLELDAQVLVGYYSFIQMLYQLTFLLFVLRTELEHLGYECAGKRYT